MVAATLAVVISSPDWVIAQLSYPNGTSLTGAQTPTAEYAIVKLFDPTTLAPHDLTVRADDRSLPQYNLQTEDRPNAPWWHTALTMALLQLGATVPVVGVRSDGTINPAGGSAWQALAALTGHEATYTLSDQIDMDAFYQLARKATFTPVLVTTPSFRKTDPLDQSHSYAIMFATDYGNGTKSITLRNPWGRTEEFEIGIVKGNTHYIGYLKDAPTLVWPSNQ